MESNEVHVCTFKKGCMSEKSLEEKYEEVYKEKSVGMSEELIRLDRQGDWLHKLWFNRGYSLAQKEMELELHEVEKRYEHTINNLWSIREKLIRKLDSAIEVIKWYADKKNCDNQDFAHIEIDSDGEEIADAGFRARDFLKKMESEK